jgi:hypothetical protein
VSKRIAAAPAAYLGSMQYYSQHGVYLLNTVLAAVCYAVQGRVNQLLLASMTMVMKHHMLHGWF